MSSNDPGNDESKILKSIVSDDVLQAIIRSEIISPARETLFGEQKRTFWIQRSIEGVIALILFFIGISTLSQWRAKINEVDKQATDEIEKRIDKRFKKNSESLERIRSELAIAEITAQRQVTNVKIAQDELDELTRLTQSFLASETWKNAKFLNFLESLYNNSKDGSTGAGLLGKLNSLEEKLKKITMNSALPPRNDPWSMASSLVSGTSAIADRSGFLLVTIDVGLAKESWGIARVLVDQLDRASISVDQRPHTNIANCSCLVPVIKGEKWSVSLDEGATFSSDDVQIRWFSPTTNSQ